MRGPSKMTLSKVEILSFMSGSKLFPKELLSIEIGWQNCFPHKGTHSLNYQVIRRAA